MKILLVILLTALVGNTAPSWEVIATPKNTNFLYVWTLQNKNGTRQLGSGHAGSVTFQSNIGNTVTLKTYFGTNQIGQTLTKKLLK